MIQATCYEKVIEGDIWTRRMKAQKLPDCKRTVSFNQEVGYQVNHWVPAEERWVVLQNEGIVYVWNPLHQEWLDGRGRDLEDFAMTKEQALSVLESVEPLKS